jgi:hypothetical protein
MLEYTAEPGSSSADALTLLASWAATPEQSDLTLRLKGADPDTLGASRTPASTAAKYSSGATLRRYSGSLNAALACSTPVGDSLWWFGTKRVDETVALNVAVNCCPWPPQDQGAPTAPSAPSTFCGLTRDGPHRGVVLSGLISSVGWRRDHRFPGIRTRATGFALRVPWAVTGDCQ